MDYLISTRSIVKRFGAVPVLDNIELNILRGEVFAIAGSSGSGKTTLLRILMGFYKPDEGTIEYEGKDITHNIQTIRSLVGLTTQENSFYKRLTVSENLRFYGMMYKVSTKEIRHRIPRILSMIGLEEQGNRLAKTLSGGMMRRLDFGISLIHDPPILILDEPTTGLDPLLRRRLWEVVLKAKRLGKTIIFTSHLLDEVEQYAGRVAILSNSKIVALGGPQQYTQHYGKPFREVFEQIIQQEGSA